MKNVTKRELKEKIELLEHKKTKLEQRLILLKMELSTRTFTRQFIKK